MGEKASTIAIHINLTISELKLEIPMARQSTIEALGDIGSPKAIDPLIKTIIDDNENAKYAQKALLKIGTLEVLEKIIVDPKIDIFNPHIFSLSRTLAVRFSKIKSPSIPVFQDIIKEYKQCSDIQDSQL